jgi:hypothetical protein
MVGGLVGWVAWSKWQDAGDLPDALCDATLILILGRLKRMSRTFDAAHNLIKVLLNKHLCAGHEGANRFSAELRHSVQQRFRAIPCLIRMRICALVLARLSLTVQCGVICMRRAAPMQVYQGMH